MYCICADHFKLLSMITPRNLVSFTSAIGCPSTRILPIVLGKHFGVNSMKFVLSIFKESLLAFTQEYTFDISSFISLTSESIFRPVQNKLFYVTPSFGCQPTHLVTLPPLHIWVKGEDSTGCAGPVYHYSDVIMSTMASQITGASIVCSIFFRRRSKRTPKLHATGLCEGNPPVTGHFKWMIQFLLQKYFSRATKLLLSWGAKGLFHIFVYNAVWFSTRSLLSSTQWNSVFVCIFQMIEFLTWSYLVIYFLILDSPTKHFTGLSGSSIWFEMPSDILGIFSTLWRHQMETFSVLLALCPGKTPVTGEFPAQRPVTQSFDVFVDLCLNKRLSKQSWGWWFETPKIVPIMTSL